MLKGFVNPADATDCNCDISPIAPCTEIVNWFKGATQKASSGPGALAWEPGAWVCYWPWYSHHLEQASLFGTPDLSLIYKPRGWTVRFLGSFQLQHSLTPWKYSVQNLPLLLLFSLQWTLRSFYYTHCVSGQGRWDLEHKASPGRTSWIVFTWHRCPNQAQETWVLGRTENEYLEARKSHQWNPTGAFRLSWRVSTSSTFTPAGACFHLFLVLRSQHHCSTLEGSSACISPSLSPGLLWRSLLLRTQYLSSLAPYVFRSEEGNEEKTGVESEKRGEGEDNSGAVPGPPPSSGAPARGTSTHLTQEDRQTGRQAEGTFKRQIQRANQLKICTVRQFFFKMLFQINFFLIHACRYWDTGKYSFLSKKKYFVTALLPK